MLVLDVVLLILRIKNSRSSKNFFLLMIKMGTFLTKYDVTSTNKLGSHSSCTTA